ncbi:amino acid permease [Paludibacterium purpuratum]|uniref:Serine transporter n=1 Tax=Paludibacterium purpuratum TaxID=1144873 RepID=A0A4R7AZA8_9NEIS|nr:aromatic amino acid transport family protein [Paludibacterium purpuratum]TDR73584.1 serine transporter [Paludibacterium purpuratum]
MNIPAGMKAGTTQHDVEWILTLFGTAVGAGILFLPIQAGFGGIWPVLILSCVSFPVVWLSHRTLTHLVVTHKQPCELPQVVEDDLGGAAGLAVSLLYLMFYLALVVAFATGMINIAATYIENQLGLEAMPRPILCLLIALGLSAVMLTAGESAILRITSGIAFPLIAALLFLSIYLIPSWNPAMFAQVPDAWALSKSLLLIVPILYFSMDFSPICAMLAASYRRHYPDARVAMRRSDRAVYWSSLMLLVFVLFFTFSCVLATEQHDLTFALQHNIDVLTLMSLHIKPRLLRYSLPLLAFATILHSYFSAFLGARNGLIGLLGQWRRQQQHPHGLHSLEWITTLAIALPLWGFALADPSILALIGMVAAPIIALVCYVMPVYIFRRVPRLAIYRERASVLVLLAGLLVMVSYWVGTHL